jgi:hypothetical protein
MVYVIYEVHDEGDKLCSKVSYVVNKNVSDYNHMRDTATWVPIFQKNLKLPSSGYRQMLVFFSRHGLLYYDVSNCVQD